MPVSPPLVVVVIIVAVYLIQLDQDPERVRAGRHLSIGQGARSAQGTGCDPGVRAD